MESVVTCVCGKSFRAAPHLAGKRVKCPSCGTPIDIPHNPPDKADKKHAVPSHRPAGTSQPANQVERQVTCACGKSFRAAPHLAGRRVKCPSCGGSIDIPQAGLGADGDDQVFASPHPAISASPPGEHEEVKDEYGFGLPPSDGGVDAGFWDACAPQEANSAAADRKSHV